MAEDMPMTVFTTPSGDRMVVIPLGEYRALKVRAEEGDDSRAYDDARRRLASGEDELLPSVFADRILDGENPVRVWREYRRLGVVDLARAAGISQAYLSQIETGRRAGSARVLARVAAALNLTLDDIV